MTGAIRSSPPGVKLYQQLQLIAASVERVMTAHPSALLKRLWRLLAVLNAFQQEFEQLKILFGWIHHIAPLLKAETDGEEAQSEVVAFVRGLHQNCPHAELLSLVAYVEKITLAFIPHLFEYIKHLSCLAPIEFIPIKPWVARALNGRESYATHNRLP